MSVKISMLLKADGKMYSEKEFVSNIKELSPYFESEADIDGYLIIKEENGKEIEIDDDLGYNVFHLALNGSVNLLETGNTVMNYSAYEGEVKLEVMEDSVLLEGDCIEDGIFPKNDFIQELILCGKRYIDLLKSIEPEGRFDYHMDTMLPVLKKAEELFATKQSV